MALTIADAPEIRSRVFGQLQVGNTSLLDQFIIKALTDSSGFDPTVQGGLVGGVFFPDIIDAMAAALAGQTVFIGEGNYTPCDILNGTQNGINIVISEGAIFTGTTGDLSKAIFDSSTIASPASGFTGNIIGDGIFSKPTDGSFTGTLFLGNANDDVYFCGKSIVGNENAAVWMEQGQLRMNITESVRSTDANCFLIENNAISLNLSCPIIEDTAGGDAIDLGNGTNIIHTSRIISNSGVPLRGGFSANNTVYFDTITAGNNSAVNQNSSGVMSLIGQLIVNNSGTPTFSDFSGLIDVRNVNNNGSGPIFSDPLAASDTTLLNGNYTSDAAIGTINITLAGAQMEIINCRVTNSNAGANAAAVNIILSDLILREVVFVTNGGDSVRSTAPTDIRVYSGIANKAVSADTTQKENNLKIDALTT